MMFSMNYQRVNLRILVFCLLFHFCAVANAQNEMQKGFDFLENGEWGKAELFFKNYLSNEPDNRTANICYARALGLQGKTELAEDIFIRLDRKYPQDYEIGLNLAECYMWQKQTEKALQKYSELLRLDPNNYVANLGYANALSAQNSFRLSKDYIDRAIRIDPNNEEALVSKKYIYMAFADSLRTDGLYKTSETILKELDEEYPNDREIRLNLAVLYLMENRPINAKDYYRSLLTDGIDTLEGYLGLSYTSILLNRKKEALRYAKQAESFGKKIKAEDQEVRIGIAKLDALAFNKEWDENAQELIRLQKRFGNIKELQLANARRSVWRGNFEEGRRAYAEMIKVNEDDYKVLLGLAEVLNAQGFSHQALQYAYDAKETSPGNLDVVRAIRNVQNSRQAYGQFNLYSSSDNGSNETSLADGKLFLHMIKNFRPYSKISYQRAYSPILAKSSYLTQLVFGTEHNLTRFFKWDANLGWSFASPNPESDVSNVIGEISLTSRFNRINTLDFFYRREMHSYSVDLIANNIAMNHYGMNYNFITDIGLGFYGQYMLTSQSDTNFRNLFFGSLYFTLRESPSIKVGVNYSQMGYDFNRGDLYFSPDIYRNTEAFIQVLNLFDQRAKILYHLNLVFGTQKIEVQNNQSTQRLDIEFGYRFSKRFDLLAYYNFSNAAQSTVSGFTFNRIGIKSRVGF